MSDTTEQTDVTPKGIDRRSALKKAAVGGAIAWTVPTVLSSTASALTGTTCTPKCSPVTAATIGLTAYVYCINGDPGQKALFIYASTPGGGFSCPCGGPADLFLAVSDTWDRHAGSCTGTVTGNVGAKTCFGSSVGAPFAGEGICLQANAGAVGNSYFTGRILAQIFCTDRSGDQIFANCVYSACVQYNPGTSNCTGTVSSVGTATKVSCPESCIPAP